MATYGNRVMTHEPALDASAGSGGARNVLDSAVATCEMKACSMPMWAATRIEALCPACTDSEGVGMAAGVEH
jgi:hypothetical protein